MSIRDWFRTTAALSREFSVVRTRVEALMGALEASEADREDLRAQLEQATLERDRAWQQVADPWPPAPRGPFGDRGELLRERARADELAKRVHELQIANMARDLG